MKAAPNDQGETRNRCLVVVLVETDGNSKTEPNILENTQCVAAVDHRTCDFFMDGVVGLSRRTGTGQTEQVARDEKCGGLAGGPARDGSVFTEDSEANEAVQGRDGSLARDP